MPRETLGEMADVELFYRHYDVKPVTEKYLEVKCYGKRKWMKEGISLVSPS